MIEEKVIGFVSFKAFSNYFETVVYGDVRTIHCKIGVWVYIRSMMMMMMMMMRRRRREVRTMKTYWNFTLNDMTYVTLMSLCQSQGQSESNRSKNFPIRL